MKLPSISHLSEALATSFKRFPTTVISAFIAVSLGVYLVSGGKNLTDNLILINLILTFAIAVPLSVAATLCMEQKNKKKSTVLIYTLLVIIVALVFISLPSNKYTQHLSKYYIIYTLYAAIAHLAVAFIPYLNSGKTNAFWNYNKCLFTRFCSSVLYSVFIYVGLSLAILACNLLLGFNTSGHFYFQLFIVVAGLFNTWYFVAGIPQNLNSLEQINDYPKGLKIFTQYILIPLLVIYFLIVYAYSGIIIVQWEWPKGMVSWLISIISLLGIFSFLLLHPFRLSSTKNWIKNFNKAFYYLLLPLIILLFLAITYRTLDYGITINRYLIYTLCIWLSIVSVHAIFKPNNIKFIPISLAATLFLISFGPWGVFSVSQRSQTNRLIEILEKSGIILGGKVQNEYQWTQNTSFTGSKGYTPQNEYLLNREDHNEVLSILEYLETYHGFEMFNEIFSQNMAAVIKKATEETPSITTHMLYQRTLSLKPRRYQNYGPSPEFQFYSCLENRSVSSEGYTTVNHFHIGSSWEEDKIHTTDHISYPLEYNFSESMQIKIIHNNHKHSIDLASIVDKNQLQNKTKNRQLSGEQMSIEKAFNDLKVKIYLKMLNTKQDEKKLSIQSAEGLMLVKEKEE